MKILSTKSEILNKLKIPILKTLNKNIKDGNYHSLYTGSCLGHLTFWICLEFRYWDLEFYQQPANLKLSQFRRNVPYLLPPAPS